MAAGPEDGAVLFRHPAGLSVRLFLLLVCIPVNVTGFQ
jgi:hypothetical protein